MSRWHPLKSWNSIGYLSVLDFHLLNWHPICLEFLIMIVWQVFSRKTSDKRTNLKLLHHHYLCLFLYGWFHSSHINSLNIFPVFISHSSFISKCTFVFIVYLFTLVFLFVYKLWGNALAYQLNCKNFTMTTANTF